MFKLPIFSSGFKKTKNTAGLKMADQSVVSQVKKSSPVKKNISKKKIEIVNGNSLTKTSGYNTVISQALRNPIITEKAGILKDLDKYVFEVTDNTSKNEIEKAINDLYKVKVVKVNILRTAGKEKRRGRIIGWQPGHKKAIVTLKAGEKIDFGI